MNADQLADGFLKTIETLVDCKEGKWAFREFKTSRGVELRNGFLDACSELFVPFVGQPMPVIYAAIREAFRRRGDHWAVQRYGGMVLLNLVPDAYGQVDELMDIIAPVFSPSNSEVPAFLVEQVGLEVVLRKIQERKKTATNPEISSRLDSMAYQARVYYNKKTRKIGWHSCG